MSFILTTILVICTCQILSIIILNALHRKHLSNMHGMLTSMALGMLSGILFGTVIGILQNGDLFMSTFLAILIGLSIGFIAGLPFNLFAVIDGSISGMMGGMMGAMLEMIPMFNPDATIKLLAFFTIMLLLIMTYLTEESIKGNRMISVRTHPFFYTITIVLLFFLIKDIPIINIEQYHNHSFFDFR